MPGAATNQSFMETMMGVKEDLHEDHQKLFDFVETAPKYSAIAKFKVLGKFAWRFMNMKTIVTDFLDEFNTIYLEYKNTEFQKKSLPELVALYQNWQDKVTYGWKPPIMNDFFCMFFFGSLKKLTEKWIQTEKNQSLQNDLLCGQGDLESTMPTKTLMIIATELDQKDQALVDKFRDSSIDDALELLRTDKALASLNEKFEKFLDDYGFRCNDEQKLEENDLTDDPSFAIGALQSYLRTKSYSVEKMRENELVIREKAEKIVNGQLKTTL
jgi:pyruvate,water dikinase